MPEDRPTFARAVAVMAPALGVVLGAAAFVVWIITEPARFHASWGVMAPGVLGAALIVGGVVFNFRRLREALFTRRAAVGLNVAFMVVFAFGALIFVNAISAQRQFSSYWTEQEVFDLSSKTRNVLGELARKGRPLRLTALLGGDELSARLRVLLKEYARACPLLTVREMNFYRETQGVQVFKSKLKNPPSSEAIALLYGDREKVIPVKDLVEVTRHDFFSARPAKRPRFRGEAVLTNAIKGLIESGKAKIYFTAGHGEFSPRDFGLVGLSGLAKALQREYYEVGEVDLRKAGKVPKDCAVLAVVGPMRAFAQAEERAVSKYVLERNGKVLVMVLPAVAGGRLTGLREFLYDTFRVNVRPDLLVLEPPRSALNPSPLNLEVSDLGDHAITRDLRNLTATLSWACPLFDMNPRKWKPGKAPKYKVSPLARTSARAWGEAATTLRSTADLRKGLEDPSGPFVLAVAVERREAKKGEASPRVVIIGNATSATNQVLSSDRKRRQYVNRSFLLGAINWLAKRDYDVGVEPLRLKERPLEIRPSGRRAIRLICWFVTPASLALLAGIVLWRRGH